MAFLSSLIVDTALCRREKGLAGLDKGQISILSATGCTYYWLCLRQQRILHPSWSVPTHVGTDLLLYVCPQVKCMVVEPHQHSPQWASTCGVWHLPCHGQPHLLPDACA